MIGKPYSGKLNVRFDEGELEIEPMLLRQLSTLPPKPHSTKYSAIISFSVASEASQTSVASL
jgi:hypothetical protein